MEAEETRGLADTTERREGAPRQSSELVGAGVSPAPLSTDPPAPSSALRPHGVPSRSQVMDSR